MFYILDWSHWSTNKDARTHNNNVYFNLVVARMTDVQCFIEPVTITINETNGLVAKAVFNNTQLAMSGCEYVDANHFDLPPYCSHTPLKDEENRVPTFITSNYGCDFSYDSKNLRSQMYFNRKRGIFVHVNNNDENSTIYLDLMANKIYEYDINRNICYRNNALTSDYSNYFVMNVNHWLNIGTYDFRENVWFSSVTATMNTTCFHITTRLKVDMKSNTLLQYDWMSNNLVYYGNCYVPDDSIFKIPDICLSGPLKNIKVKHFFE